MTAEEMFKELGFVKHGCSHSTTFDFASGENKYIVFEHESKTYTVCLGEYNREYDYMEEPDMSVQLHKAITKQMEELKWL